MNNVATVAKELGELKALLNEFRNEVSTEIKEVKNILHGVRLDLNQIAKTNNLSLASHEHKAERVKQRLVNLEMAGRALEKSKFLKIPSLVDPLT
jgi:hypothetical protein